MGRIRTQHCTSCTARPMSTYPASNEGYPKVCEDLTITEKALTGALLYDRCELSISIDIIVKLWSWWWHREYLSLFVSPWQIKWLSASGQSRDCRAAALCNWAQCQHSVSSPAFAVQADCYITRCYTVLHVTCSYRPEYKAAHVCRVWVYLFIQPVLQPGPRQLVTKLGQGVLCVCGAAHFTRHQTGMSQFRTWHWQAGLWLYWCAHESLIAQLSK